MTTDAAMQADYCDLKIIKTRKVLQIVLEIPQEAGNAFIAAFGLPQVNGVPVAIARLTTITATESDGGEADYSPPKPKGGELARRAGIVCDEPAFDKFIAEKHDVHSNGNLLFVRNWMRLYCDVQSRAELDHNPEAARKFRELMAEYQAWRAQ